MIVLLVTVSGAHAQKRRAPAAKAPAAPATAPELVIEAGCHTASLRSISADAAGRLVLTVSHDKTARLWELPSGRMLRVLRPPRGDGNEGKLYAGALTPDGSVAAVGGFTGKANSGDFSVYLFDTSTGRLLGRAPGLPNSVSALAFSSDGRLLAAVCHSGGLRIWETATGRETARDTDYQGTGESRVHWHGENRLVTTGIDGRLRLYTVSPDGGLGASPKKIALPAGKEPGSVQFSPDGSKIAVGFNSSAAVTVFDANDPGIHFDPDAAGGNEGGLFCVAWTTGGTLAATGQWPKKSGQKSSYMIRRWPEMGRGQPLDTQVVSAGGAVSSMHPLPEGRLLYSCSDGAWGVLDSQGEGTLLNLPQFARYYQNRRGFRPASAGHILTVFGGNLFETNPPPLSEPARTLLKSFTDLGKRDTIPKFKGKPLPVSSNESTRCVTCAADGSAFLVGTNWNLGCFSAKGTRRWVLPAPASVMHVSFVEENRLALVLYADATIRWYRADNGRELLAFSLHNDLQRWIMWTPEGYYDASPGAEDFIGWHVSRGPDASGDFFPASRFRSVFYRPDVVERVLKTRDTMEALHAADVLLGRKASRPEQLSEVIRRLSPPVVELQTGTSGNVVKISPQANGVVVRYRVRQTGTEAPTKVTMRFNGRLVESSTPLPRAGETAEATLILPESVNGEVSVFAEHALATSEAAVLRIEWEPRGTEPRKPNLYAVAAGVSRYKINETEDGETKTDSMLPDLRHAANDAGLMANTLRLQEGGLFGRVTIRTLLDKEATTANIRTALQDMAREARPEDVTIMYFSGHGAVDRETGFYLATHDANPLALASTALAGRELTALLEGVKARTVLALDACRSGGVSGGAAQGKIVTGPGDLKGFIHELSSAEQGNVVFSSSLASEDSFEDAKAGGVFTRAFCDGLVMPAEKVEPVTCASLRSWLSKRVPEHIAALAENVPGMPRQTPVCVIPRGVPDFSLALTPVRKTGPVLDEAATPHTKTNWELLSVGDWHYVSLESIQKFYEFPRFQRTGKAGTLRSEKLIAQVEADSTTIWINNVKFIASRPVLEQDGKLWLSRMDLAKLIHPVIKPTGIANSEEVKTIVLDAAYGGDDRGRESATGPEKDFTLDTIKRARALLEKEGFSVVLTRDGDTTVSVEDRVRIANQAKGVLISVNFGSGDTGIETRTLAPQGVAASGNVLQESDSQAQPANIVDGKSIALATSAHAMLILKIPLYDRGIRRSRTPLLQELTIPGVVISCGALDNVYDARDIATEEYRQLVAACICNAAVNYRKAIHKGLAKKTGSDPANAGNPAETKADSEAEKSPASSDPNAPPPETSPDASSPTHPPPDAPAPGPQVGEPVEGLQKE